jgi:hypothetical protein
MTISPGQADRKTHQFFTSDMNNPAQFTNLAGSRRRT